MPHLDRKPMLSSRFDDLSMLSYLFLELLAPDERILELCAAKMRFYWCNYDVCAGFTLPIPLLSLIFFKGSIGLNTVNLSIDVLICGKDNPPAPFLPVL